MRTNSKPTVGRTDLAPGQSSRNQGFTRVLQAVLFLALFHNPIKALGATLPPTYAVSLAWDSSMSTGVTGYRLYYGTASGNYMNSILAGNVTAVTLTGLAAGATYFFAVNAYDANGQESPFSKEIAYTTPSGRPMVQIGAASNRQLILTVTGLVGHTYDIQATKDFTAWTVIGTVTLGANGSAVFTDTNAASFPRRFYRTHDTTP